ncbi:MAG: hypothetical protein ACO274_06600 [Vulcanococcus sp.]
MRLPAALEPVRFSLSAAAALVLTPAALLLLWPRPTATGLDRLLPHAALLQSFSLRRSATPPLLWQQRLGAEAPDLWRQQRRLWWQFWGSHGDAGASLVLLAPSGQRPPVNALQLDNLWVVAPSALARQSLQEQLKLQRPAPRGLEQRCAQQLQRQDAVFWTASGLSSLLGAAAPLAQSVQVGCLNLRSEGTSLLWSGEADAAKGALASEPPSLGGGSPPALSAEQLLTLQGPELGLLLQGLLSSSVLKDSLVKRYGLTPYQLKLLSQAPFALRLSRVPSGPFRASLELQVALVQGQGRWTPWLKQLERVLQDQDLQLQGGDTKSRVWLNAEGVLLGGWRWTSKQDLLFSLGAAPTAAPLKPLQLAKDSAWTLEMRPKALQERQLLPQSLPIVVRRAETLVLQGQSRSSRAAERQSALRGQLNLR